METAPQVSQAAPTPKPNQLKVGSEVIPVEHQMLDPLYELNQCAFNSQASDHRQALIHAERAIQALEQEVMLLRTKIESATNEYRVTDAEKNLFLERTSLLSIAYYNKGCECEHMKKIIKAAQAFGRAVNLQSGHQGNQILLKQFKLSLKQARYKLRQQVMPSNYVPGQRRKHLCPADEKDEKPTAPQQKTHYEQKFVSGGNFDKVTEILQTMQKSRPQSAFHTLVHRPVDQIPCSKGGAQPRKLTVNTTPLLPVALSSSAASGAQERMEEFANSSVGGERKKVLSEFDAVTQFTVFSQNRQTAAMQHMMHRPPKHAQHKTRMRQRGVQQVSQRRENQQKLQKLGHAMSHPAMPTSCPPILEKQRSASQKEEQQSADSKKKLIEKGGKLSLGSQHLFKSGEKPPAATKSNLKPPLQIEETKEDHSASGNALPKLEIATPKNQTPDFLTIHTKTVAPVQPVIGSPRSRAKHKEQEETKPAPDATKSAQETAKPMLSMKTVLTAKSLLAKRKKKINDRWAQEFKAYCDSRQDDPNFIKAIQTIKSFVRRWKLRRIVRQVKSLNLKTKNNLMVMRVIIKLQCQFRRRLALKRVENQKTLKRISGNLRLLALIVQLQSKFRQRLARKRMHQQRMEKSLKTVPGFRKGVKRIQSWWRWRKFQKLVHAVVRLRKLEKSGIKLNSISDVQNMLQKDQKLLVGIGKAKPDSVQQKISSEFNQVASRLKANIKRRVFKKMTWDQMYLKICQDDPRKLAMIIHVQKRWRQNKARRIVYEAVAKQKRERAEYLKTFEESPVKMKALKMIQGLFRRRKFYNAAKVLIAREREKARKAKASLSAVIKRRRARKLIQKAVQNKELITKDDAARKIQKWFKSTKLRVFLRNAFISAGPIQAKTIKQQGVYWKCIASIHDTETLQFRIKSLPSLKNQQDLLVPLPPTRSMLFSRKEFINDQMRNITVNMFGVAKLQAPGSKQKNNQYSFASFAPPKQLKDLTPEQVQLVVKIQRYYRRLKFRRMIRKVFIDAAPIYITTFRERGCYFKLMVSVYKINQLLFTFQTLPSLTQSQELIVDLPRDRDIKVSDQDYARFLAPMIQVSAFGACRLPKDIDFTKFNKDALPNLNQKVLTLQHQEKKAPKPVPQKAAPAPVPVLEKIEPVPEKPALKIVPVPEITVPVLEKSASVIERTVSVPEQIAPAPELKKVGASLSKASQSIEEITQELQKDLKPSVKSIKSTTSSQKKPATKPPITSGSQTHKSKLTTPKQISPRNSSHKQSTQQNFAKFKEPLAPVKEKEPIIKTHPDVDISMAKSLKELNSPSLVKDSARSDLTYKVQVEPDHLKDTRLVFQPAFVKKHQYLMATLIKKHSAVDRKILPLDLYLSTTTLDMYDPEQFVREHLMPCIRVREKGTKQIIELDETKLKELKQKCETQKQEPKQQSESSLKKLAKKVPNTVSAPHILTMTDKKANTLAADDLNAMMRRSFVGPINLIKRKQLIDATQYSYKVSYDLDSQQMMIVAECSTQSYSLNLELNTAQQSIVQLHQYAEEITRQLTVTEKGLGLQQTEGKPFNEEDVVYRTGKTMNNVFYLVSVGHDADQLLIEAQDGVRGQRVNLRMEWSGANTITYEDAQSLVAKLDTMMLGEQLMLVLR